MSKLLLLPLSLLALVSCSPEPQKKDPDPPNIILIMGDDMGYSDLACYGGEINTPNLDGLAMKGLRFTQFYNTARCCPTRASLMTGLYPQQAGIGHMMSDRGTDAYRGDLSKQAVTIAEVLKAAGYSTYMSGKWHITPYDDTPEGISNPRKHNWPRQRGFDKFFGMISGAGSFYDPRSLAEDNEWIAPGEDFYFTDAVTEYALDRIDAHEGENPFFMYVAYTAAHWPMHAWPEDIEKYKGKYDRGWDVMRQERMKRMKALGLISPETSMTPRDEHVPAWSEDIPDKEWEIANMEVYAAMVDCMDRGIGKIVASLKERGEYENTLIFFLQDNGACAEDLSWMDPLPEVPEEMRKPMEEGAFQTRMIPPITRDGKVVKLMKAAQPGPPEGYTAYGLPWANSSNTPFREYKHWVHEGGIASPLIIHWPEKINGDGAFRKEPSHLIDIMATCIDVANANYPQSYKGNSIIPYEGKSLVPAFDDIPLDREAIYWEHEGNRAVRMGKWKLVSKADKNRSFIWDKVEEMEVEDWELFDMEKDRTETANIAAEQPELVQKMAAMWMAWAKRTGTVPRPN
ncbi:MAG: arylsulfatase [Bacteroidota bacterium]